MDPSEGGLNNVFTDNSLLRDRQRILNLLNPPATAIFVVLNNVTTDNFLYI